MGLVATTSGAQQVPPRKRGKDTARGCGALRLSCTLSAEGVVVPETAADSRAGWWGTEHSCQLAAVGRPSRPGLPGAFPVWARTPHVLGSLWCQADWGTAVALAGCHCQKGEAAADAPSVAISRADDFNPGRVVPSHPFLLIPQPASEAAPVAGTLPTTLPSCWPQSCW